MFQNERRRRAHLAALLLLASAAGGCSGQPDPVDNLPRVAVTGNVSFDGKPLEVGKIQFQPIAAEPAVMAIGDIHDGKFSIDRPHGPCPGKYRVLISSLPSTTVAEGEEPGSARRDLEKIPKRYNLQSTLEVDIAPESPAPINFDLVRKP